MGTYVRLVVSKLHSKVEYSAPNIFSYSDYAIRQAFLEPVVRALLITKLEAPTKLIPSQLATTTMYEKAQKAIKLLRWPTGKRKNWYEAVSSEDKTSSEDDVTRRDPPDPDDNLGIASLQYRVFLLAVGLGLSILCLTATLIYVAVEHSKHTSCGTQPRLGVDQTGFVPPGRLLDMPIAAGAKRREKADQLWFCLAEVGEPPTWQYLDDDKSPWYFDNDIFLDSDKIQEKITHLQSIHNCEFTAVHIKRDLGPEGG